MTKVTGNVEEALRLVSRGTPVVLVGRDAAALGEAVGSLACAPREGDDDGGGCLLAVMVGDLSDPEVAAAATEMAGELWPWASGR